jgi:peroxiredoxin 2/4
MMSAPLPIPEAAAAPSLRIWDVAPDFSARTTMGERRLSDYRGRWLLFFSHPADFTPVCSSEFVSLARRAPEFAALDCDLLALSVDSLFAHLAWLRDLDERLGVRVPFPVVEDPSMVIARAYGMLDAAAASSATVRASFVIDPAGIVRAISWYPMQVGRSVDELLRLVAALQTADREGASTPEGWRVGAALLEPNALTQDEAAARPESPGPWYLAARRP